MVVRADDGVEGMAASEGALKAMRYRIALNVKQDRRDE
jgi:hypothetical protein